MAPSEFIVTTAPGFEGEARRELRRLVPDAQAAVTVKFTSGRWRRLLRDATGRLEACYEVVRTRRLPHNRRETTVLLRRRPGP